MLIRFVINNFMSFKDNAEFNMLIGKNYKSHMNHVKKTKSKVGLIKAAAVYGANGSGKSNLVNAIEFLKNLVDPDYNKLNNKPLMPMSKRFKIDPNYINKPTSFRIEFEMDSIHFDYGIELFKSEIVDEWLYIIDSIDKDNEKLTFHRKKGKSISYGEILNKEDLEFAKKYERKILRANEPFISKSEDIFGKNRIFKKFHIWFEKLIIIHPYGEPLTIPQISRRISLKDFSCKILRESKTGINGLIVKEIPIEDFFGYEDEDLKNEILESLSDYVDKSKSGGEHEKYSFGVLFDHKGSIYHATIVDNKPIILVLSSIHGDNIEFDLDEESDGTNRLIELMPPFYKLLHNDNVVIIDEIERSMHPILARQLLELYLSKSETKSQLIFTTHESNLLDLELFRQDEIWFVEKKEEGSSEFYPLSDFGERYDKDIRKGYLQGRYGAIPFMSNLKDLSWEKIN